MIERKKASMPNRDSLPAWNGNQEKVFGHFVLYLLDLLINKNPPVDVYTCTIPISYFLIHIYTFYGFFI